MVAETGDSDKQHVEWWEKDAPQNVHDAQNSDELLEALQEAEEKDQLVVLEFWQKSCLACRALYPKLLQIAAKYPEEVSLIKVEYDKHEYVCKRLGVDRLPFFHFYRAADGQVESFPATLMKVAKLRAAIEKHIQPRCSLTCPYPKSINHAPMLHQLMAEKESST
ncbi:hypothetical protein CYMTET_46402 [Cymbomonas tetramitiformis]|uniref:Thioredoxin domain-containing protein n=1 Tax=Cymbomonas tetramitiformis TaxID=36881 RepID=A0AAE0BW81_9CHLO|nr:hypothetical protein CYMTET_46402 [Cymbomonas tetramitiformis]